MPLPVAALVLAAGSSSRFKTDKRLARLREGCTVLEQTVENCVEAGLEVLLVLGADDDVLSAQFNEVGIKTVMATDSHAGMGCSLAAGASNLGNAPAALVVLGDMPFVKPVTMRSLADKLLAGASIARPQFMGQPGNPVGFSCDYYGALAALSGDRGGRDILLHNSAAILDVMVEDEGILQDIDYPSDLPVM